MTENDNSLGTFLCTLLFGFCLFIILVATINIAKISNKIASGEKITVKNGRYVCQMVEKRVPENEWVKLK